MIYKVYSLVKPHWALSGFVHSISNRKALLVVGYVMSLSI